MSNILYDKWRNVNTSRLDVVEDLRHDQPGHTRADHEAGGGASQIVVDCAHLWPAQPLARTTVAVVHQGLDPRSVGSSGDYPLAWAQSFGSGRTYYNALGHFDTTWIDARFQQQLRGAFRWVARR